MYKKYILSAALGVVIALVVVWAFNVFGTIVDKEGASLVSAKDIINQVKEEGSCSCGCGYSLEDCEKYDPNCPVRPSIVSNVESLAEQGKSKDDILALLRGESLPKDLGNIEDDDPVKGSLDAPVTIVEFSDFQCPFCATFYSQTLSKIEQEYVNTGKVKIVYRDFPLSFHQYAQKAAEASECAQEQDKFWEYHDILFERQSEWASGGVVKFKDYARELGLDQESFDYCLDSNSQAEEVLNDFAAGREYGVTGTPAFFINGELLSGAQPFEVFKQAIEKALK